MGTISLYLKKARTAVFFLPGVSEVERRTSAADKPPFRKSFSTSEKNRVKTMKIFGRLISRFSENQEGEDIGPGWKSERCVALFMCPQSASDS